MQPDLLREPQRSNRRRRLVFLATLAAALAISLAFTWLRSPQYRASARLEITPGVGSVTVGSAIAPPAPVSTTASHGPFLTEVQVLTSRPVLELAAEQLQRSRYDLSAFGPEPVAGMQGHVDASPVEGTNVVELAATGPRAELLAPVLSAIVDVYQSRLADAYRNSTRESLAQADEEVKKLEERVTAKRRDVEAFRLRNNIVSLQRDENEVLARVRNLSTSLATANERAAAAEGKTRALESAAASGKTAVRARDDPTLANLEQRASQIREDLRNVERDFTQDYMAKDPKVIQQQARLAELERQITAQRAASQQTALLEAQEELAGAQGAVERIQSQMAASRQEAAHFTARFNEYQSRQDELGELEKAQREAVERRARLEATERARMPAVRLLEAASKPREPWRPLYWRDTALSIGGSLALALFVMWLVELLNRTERQPSLVLIQPQPGALPFEMAPQFLSGTSSPQLSSAGASAARLEASEPTLLPHQPRFPRELRQDEVAALLGTADDETRLIVLLLLSGVSSDEALKLHWGDVDAERGLIRAGGVSAREVAMGYALRQFLAAAPKMLGMDPILGSHALPATRESIEAPLLCAALDAGIEAPAQVTAECIRHTYVAFLVRQGIRFADLTRIVGRLPADIIGAYSTLSPESARLAGAAVEVVYPALREVDSK